MHKLFLVNTNDTVDRARHKIISSIVQISLFRPKISSANIEQKQDKTYVNI